jgi:hypothetical protein
MDSSGDPHGSPLRTSIESPERVDRCRRFQPAGTVPRSPFYPVDQRAAGERALQGLVSEGGVERPVGAEQPKLRVAIDLRLQRIQEAPLHPPHGDVLHPMDRPRPGLPAQQRQVGVGVERHARRGLGGLVQALGGGGSDVDPGEEQAREVADGDGGLVVRGEAALAERDALFVLEGVREGAGEHVAHRLGGVPGDPQVEGLVDAAVDVRELDLEMKHRRRLGHRRRL